MTTPAAVSAMDDSVKEPPVGGLTGGGEPPITSKGTGRTQLRALRSLTIPPLSEVGPVTVTLRGGGQVAPP